MGVTSVVAGYQGLDIQGNAEEVTVEREASRLALIIRRDGFSTWVPPVARRRMSPLYGGSVSPKNPP